MLELAKQLSGGVAGTALFLAGYWLVRLLVARSHGLNRVRLAEITAAGKRDEHSLNAESAAFRYLEQSLERSQKEEEELRQENERLREQLYEAQLGSFNTRTLMQSNLLHVDKKIKLLEHALAQATTRKTELEFRIVNLHALAVEMRDALQRLDCRDLPALPPLPAWIEEPRRLTDGEEES